MEHSRVLQAAYDRLISLTTISTYPTQKRCAIKLKSKKTGGTSSACLTFFSRSVVVKNVSDYFFNYFVLCYVLL